MLGGIYKLIPYNCDEFYIGSTENMKDREATHIQDAKTRNSKVYQKIRECKGFDMVLLYEYECENETELRMEEQRAINLLQPKLNTNRAYCSEEKKERAKLWRQNNRESVLELDKIYREKNKNKINERQKIYRENNRDKTRLYYQTNKEKIKKQRETNKEQIAEKKRLYYQNNKIRLKKERDLKKEQIADKKRTTNE